MNKRYKPDDFRTLLFWKRPKEPYCSLDVGLQKPGTNLEGIRLMTYGMLTSNKKKAYVDLVTATDDMRKF